MSQITLAVPFALPDPALAPDILRELQAPALATLLARARRSKVAHIQTHRLLPHEQWLAARSQLLPTQPGQWFLAHPAHVQITRKHLLMGDWRQLQLTDTESRQLFEAARPMCAELGIELDYLNASTWYLRADLWGGIDTASPDAACGENLADFTPEGGNALALRKLQNEIQMLWFQHPLNEAREASRRPPINGFWIWAPPASQALEPVQASNAPYALPFAATPAAGQLQADATIYLDQLSPYALAKDWGGWLQQMQELEATWFAPLLDALRSGRHSNLRLIVSNRDALRAFDCTRMRLMQFWRRPSLKALLS